MKSSYLIFGLVVLVCIAVIAVFVFKNPSESTSVDNTAVTDKVYVALEGEGKVAVIDAADNQVITTIDLTQSHDGETIRYMAHNVQVAPDGSSVAVTANVEEEMEGMNMSDEPMPGMDGHGSDPDELIIIDPKTDKIIKRIPIESDSHLAHVVYGSDNKTALVSLQEKGKVYAVDIVSGQIMQRTDLGENSGPHGLRLTPDGLKAYVALMNGKGVALMNMASGEFETLTLPGAVVQTAVTPSGAYAFASIYDTKQVAWFDTQSGGRGLVDLPSGSRGPVQLYPTPDSRYLYVVDQGYYFDQPRGSTIYRIDVANKTVDQTITGGSAPHGVVVSRDGSRAYVTNLLGNDVSVIDTASNQEINRISVGVMPNGISIWNANTGGTP